MLYTTHVEKVILVSTIPSNLAMDPQGNEETKAFNLFQSGSIPLFLHSLEHPMQG